MAQYDPTVVKTGIPSAISTDTLRADNVAVAGMVTGAIASGNACQVSAALTVQAALNTSTSPVIGVYDGTSGSIVRDGVVIANFAAGPTTAGEAVYLSAVAGQLTNVKPTGEVLHEVGVVAEVATRKVLLRPMPAVQLPALGEDMILPLVYTSTTAVRVVQAPGYTATPQVLQDGKRRTFAGTLSCALTVSGDGGLNAAVVRAVSTWYYVYLVPKSGDDTSLVLRVDTALPTVGPTGYTAWRYLGSFRTNAVGSGEVTKFSQFGNRFSFAVAQVVVSDSGGADGAPVNVVLVNFIPATAAAIVTTIMIRQTATAGWFDIYIDGEANSCFSVGTWTNPEQNAITPVIPCVTVPKQLQRKRGVTMTNEIDVTGWIDGYVS